MKKVAEMDCPELFVHLEGHARALVANSLQGVAGDRAIQLAVTGIMRQIAGDPREQDLKRWPDHGHSISPSLEIETGLPHGLAVNICASLGAAVAHFRRAYGQPILADEPLARMLRLSAALRLPIWHPLLAEPGFLAKAAAATARVRGGGHWPVPTGIGSHVYIEPTLTELEGASDLLRRHATSTTD
jgi:3-dehydroquinate synthase